MNTVYNENDCWTDEALTLADEVDVFVKNFIEQHTDWPLVELNYILSSSVAQHIAEESINRRIK